LGIYFYYNMFKIIFSRLSASFSPSDIEGLKVWLEDSGADTTTNGAVISSVTDKSGNNNTFVQATALSKPTLGTAAFGNNRSSFNFDGSDDYLECNITGVQEHTIIILWSPTTLAGFKSIAGARGTTGGDFDAVLLGTSSSSSTPNYRRGIGSGSSVVDVQGNVGDYVAGNWYITSARSTGTTTTACAQWVNAIAKGTGSSASAPLDIDKIVIGAGHYNNSVVDQYHSKIGAVLVYDRPLEDGEIRQVEEYLNLIYGYGVLADWINYPQLDSNSGALHIEAYDLDGDGSDEIISIASSDSSDPHFRIYKWNGYQFALVKDVISSAAVSAKLDRFGTEFEIADIDGDGRKEIVLVDSSNAGLTGSLLIYKHDGSITGTWTETSLDTWSGSGVGNLVTHAEVALGDLDADGKIDIVVRDISHGVWVFKNTSSGGVASVATRKFIATNPREGLFLADVYENGRLQIILNGVILDTPSDLVSGTYTIRAVEGMENWYPSSAGDEQVADYAAKVLYADFGGGNKMIVISSAEKLGNYASSSTKPLGIKAYLRPADPINDTWTEVSLINTNYSWHSLRTVTINGNLSIVSALAGVGAENPTGRITFWEGNGNGTFDSATNIESGTQYYSLCVATVAGKIHLLTPQNWNSGAIKDWKKVTS
jgi:VCBS repeat protein